MVYKSWLKGHISTRHLLSSRLGRQMNPTYPSHLAQTNPSFCSQKFKSLESSTWEAEHACAVVLLKVFILLDYRQSYPLAQVTQKFHS